MDNENQKIMRIDGKGRFLDKLFNMIQNSKEEVVLMMRYWGSRWGDRKLYDEVIFPQLQRSIETALSRGASVRIMGDLGSDEFGSSKRLHDLGVEVRNLEGALLRFIVVDQEQCLFAISEPYSETTHFYHAIWSSNSVLVRFFKDHFETLWPVCQKVY